VFGDALVLADAISGIVTLHDAHRDGVENSFADTVEYALRIEDSVPIEDVDSNEDGDAERDSDDDHVEFPDENNNDDDVQHALLLANVESVGFRHPERYAVDDVDGFAVAAGRDIDDLVFKYRSVPRNHGASHVNVNGEFCIRKPLRVLHKLLSGRRTASWLSRECCIHEVCDGGVVRLRYYFPVDGGSVSGFVDRSDGALCSFSRFWYVSNVSFDDLLRLLRSPPRGAAQVRPVDGVRWNCLHDRGGAVPCRQLLR
jgi:hypothetical protein